MNLLVSALAQAAPMDVVGAPAPSDDVWSGTFWAIRIGVCVVLLLLSALVSGAEAAINELDVWRYRRLGEGDAEVNGALQLFERDPQRFVSTLVIARTLVNVAIASFITLTALQLAGGEPGWRAALYGALVAGLVILVFGQIIPRAVVVPNAVRVSRLVIRPVYVLSIVVYPIGALFTWLTRQVLRLLRMEQGSGSRISEDELRQVLRDAEASGVIEAQERQMIRGVIDLEETVVREVMTPRVAVVAIAKDAPLRELLALVMEEGYSRLPVYADSIDNVVGMVYARDLLKYKDRDTVSEDATVSELMTAVQFVPETLSVLNLLRDMRVRKSHIAVVVDEFGGTSGVVTLEDIIEEITGEIYDETDEDEEADILVLPSGGYRLLGSAHLESIGIALDIGFDEDGDYDTLAGFLIDELGHIPEIGAAVVHAGMRFEVEQADGRRIVSVVATPVVEGQPPITDAAVSADAPAMTEVTDAAIDPVARVTTDAQARVIERAAD
ncbi:MAG TPA: hemolysin family protein [Trueperaceae bacterium]|nr:hemolysin family protein [Trueperaceae bacterium]